jgi:hypothetical protein
MQTCVARVCISETERLTFSWWKHTNLNPYPTSQLLNHADSLHEPKRVSKQLFISISGERFLRHASKMPRNTQDLTMELVRTRRTLLVEINFSSGHQSWRQRTLILRSITNFRNSNCLRPCDFETLVPQNTLVRVLFPKAPWGITSIDQSITLN